MPAKTFKILRILNHEVFVSFVFAAEEITFPHVKKCTHFSNFDLCYRKLAFDAPNTLCLSAPNLSGLRVSSAPNTTYLRASSLVIFLPSQ